MYQRKIVLLGDPAVGKTILHKYFADYPSEISYNPTLQANFIIKNIEVDYDVSVRLMIWDIAGHRNWFKLSIFQRYLNGASAAIILFDITNPSSFNNLPYWVEQITEHAGFIPMVFCGNKTDLRKKIPETIASGRGEDFSSKLAEKIGIETSYIETSALTGKNVDKAFDFLVSVILKKEGVRYSKISHHKKVDYSFWLDELDEEKED